MKNSIEVKFSVKNQLLSYMQQISKEELRVCGQEKVNVRISLYYGVCNLYISSTTECCMMPSMSVSIRLI